MEDQEHTETDTKGFIENTSLADIKNAAQFYLSELSNTYEETVRHYSTCMTLQESIDSNDNVKIYIGQYAGYDYGIIDASLNDVEDCIDGMKQIVDGDLDDLPPSSITMSALNWYQLAKSKLETVNVRIEDLENMESNILEYDIEDDTKKVKASLNRYIM